MKAKRRAVNLDAVRRARASLRKLVNNRVDIRPMSDTDLEETMARETNDAQIVVRLPQALVDRVDAYAERLRKEQPGPAWRRSDVVRQLIARAIDEVEPSKPRRR